MHTINLQAYRENKEVIRRLQGMEKYFNQEYPDKNWAWVGVTSLLFAQLAIENYMAQTKVSPEFTKILKGALWQFISVITQDQKERENGHE